MHKMLTKLCNKRHIFKAPLPSSSSSYILVISANIEIKVFCFKILKKRDFFLKKNCILVSLELYNWMEKEQKRQIRNTRLLILIWHFRVSVCFRSYVFLNCSFFCLVDGGSEEVRK